MRNGPVDVHWDFGSLPQFAQSTARYAVGIDYQTYERSIRASLIRTLGRGHQMVCDVIHCSECALPDEVIELTRGARTDADVFSDVAFWGRELADRCAELVKPLIARAKKDYSEPLVIAVDGLSVHSLQSDGFPSASLTICDPTWLAERTGITVVNELGASDIAHGGSGQPIFGMADWILFGDRSGIPGQRNRGVLRIGPEISMSIVPSRATHKRPPEVVSVGASPGMLFLRSLMNRVGDQKIGSDQAVQVRPVQRIVEAWLSRLDLKLNGDEQVSCLLRDGESQDPSITPAEWYMTAVEFLARTAAESMERAAPKSMPICELILTGELHADGLLQNRLRHFLHGISVRSGLATEVTSSVNAIACGIMGLLRIDNAIGNSTRQTGTRKPRSLGRITPGRPSNWNQVLAEMAAAMHESMTLKTAV